MSTATNVSLKSALSRFSFLGIVDEKIASFQDLLSGFQSPYIRSFAKNTILSILQKLKHGQLSFESLGSIHTFGTPLTLIIGGIPTQMKAHVKVVDESFWVRLFLHYDFGFADSYMLHLIEVDELDKVFKVFLLNREEMADMRTIISPLIQFLSAIANTRLINSTTNTRGNISSHYDLSNEVFEAFLSRDLTYSCAIFNEESGGRYGDILQEPRLAPPLPEPNDVPDDLEVAQRNKLHWIARKARIQPGHRILEIGCGWGSFSILAAQEYGATVEAITLSSEQKDKAEADIAAAGLSDRVTVRLLDYRKLPESFAGSFDSIVSIGVMEHVGHKFMRQWFEICSWALKPKTGIMVFTMTLLPEGKWITHKTEVTFLNKYIFPGGQFSSVKTLVNDLVPAGFDVDTIENHGIDYARTLREWSYRFIRNFETHIRPGLIKSYPHITDEDIEIFRRKYIYYFRYFESGFAMSYLSDMFFVLTRESNIAMLVSL